VDKPLVSIIIPAYNAEKFLEECLDSAINQTYKNLEHLEIIAVDSGSTDNTLNIMETYAQKDERIKIIHYFKNGPGATRNVGIAKATGKYIMLLDSDDYFELSLVEKLLTEIKEMENSECDVIIFNGKSFDDFDDRIVFHDENYFSLNKSNEGEIYTGFDILKLTGGRASQPCMKIYKRKFILDNNITFIENVLGGEDTIYFYECMVNAKKVKYVDVIGYYRRYRPGSTMTENPLANTADRIKSFDALLSLRDSEYVNEDNKKLLNKQFVYYACVIWAMAINRKDKSERTQTLEMYKTHRLNEFVKNNRVDFLIYVFAVFVLLSDSFIGVKILFGKFAKFVFKRKSRFFKEG